MMKSDKVCLTMDAATADMVSRACEFYTRIRLGQFQEILFECQQEPYDTTEQEAAEKFLFEARKHIYPELTGRGHSYGIGKDVRADRCYDVHQELRYALGDHRKPWPCSSAKLECRRVNE